MWYQISKSIWWRSTGNHVQPVCLQVLSCTICPRKAGIQSIRPKHSPVCVHRSLHILLYSIFISSCCHFSDLSMRCLDQVLSFLHCGASNPFFGTFLHIEIKAHGRVFQLYQTSLPCHSCRHVENLQEISYCIDISGSARTCIDFTSEESAEMVKACFVLLRAC